MYDGHLIKKDYLNKFKISDFLIKMTWVLFNFIDLS